VLRFCDVNLVSGLGPRSGRVTVDLKAGKIHAIYSDSTVPPDWPEARTIDGHGKWLLPGLIDMHTHVCVPYHQADKKKERIGTIPYEIGLAACYGLANVHQALLSGITGMRDLGGYSGSVFAVKKLVDASQIDGPHMLVAGAGLCATGTGRERLAVQADGEDEIRRVIREQLAFGADWIKLFVDGSHHNRRRNLELALDEVRAAVEVAHQRGVRVTAHANSREGIMVAIEGGCDCIEHGIGLDADLARMMADLKVGYCPTMWDHHSVGERAELLGFSARDQSALRAEYEKHEASVRLAQRSGVTIVAGTDSALTTNPKMALVWELLWLESCGLTRLEALKAATTNAAHVLGDGDISGLIEVGEHADLVLVKDDPTKDLHNLTRIEWVVKDGIGIVEDGHAVATDVLRDLWPLPNGPVPNGNES